MRVSFTTTYDPRDPGNWSGTTSHMWRSLEANGATVDLVGPLRLPLEPILRGVGYASRRVAEGQRSRGLSSVPGVYSAARSPILARHRANRITAHLRRHPADVVVSPGTVDIAALQTDVPVAFWTDAVFPAMLDFYPEFTGYSRHTVRCGIHLERQALSRCSLAVYSSEWAARGAVELCGADPKRVHVIPFGANLTEPPSRDCALAGLEARPSAYCNLLFVGVDWARKGVDFAIEVLHCVRSGGLDAELSVVGCSAPRGISVPSDVRVYGFLPMTNPTNRVNIGQLYQKAHFFILPTRAECYAVVFAEAAAYALPALSFDVGGVSTAILDGVTGRLFPLEASPQEYANYILSGMSNRAEYGRMARAARDEYERRLNWTVASQHFLQLLADIS